MSGKWLKRDNMLKFILTEKKTPSCTLKKYDIFGNFDCYYGFILDRKGRSVFNASRDIAYNKHELKEIMKKMKWKK